MVFNIFFYDHVTLSYQSNGASRSMIVAWVPRLGLRKMYHSFYSLTSSVTPRYEVDLVQFSPAWLCWSTMLGGTPPVGYYRQPGMITVLVLPHSVLSFLYFHTSLRGRPRSVLPCLVVLRYDARWYTTNRLLHTAWYDYCPGYTSLCSITSFVTPRYKVDLVQFSLAWLCWDTMLGGTPPMGYYTQPGMIIVLVLPRSVLSPLLFHLAMR